MRWLRASRILLALAVLAAPLPAARAQAAGPTYVVQEGDTLYDIAFRFGTTVDELVEANALADPSRLLPGMELILPGFPGITGVLSTRELEFGETLPVLSWALGADATSLARLNRVVNPERVYAGLDFILATREDAPPGGAQARAYPVREGEGPLQAALRAGVSPWSPESLDGPSIRRWRVTGESGLRAEDGAELRGWQAPLLDLSVSPSPLIQGKTTLFAASLSSPVEVRGSIDGVELEFLETGEGRQIALQGIRALAAYGLVEVEIQVQAEVDSDLWWAYRQPLLLEEAGYGQDPPLAVPSETIDPAFTGPEDDLVRNLVSAVTPVRYWDGTFALPSEGGTTSRFGVRRNYNNTGYLYYHSGLDFSGRTGSPILAPAPGRVVFAGLLQVRGNTTFIDHGWGVYTGYLHQSELQVVAGQMVETGQVIGLVGGTGRVTGPHLHWEVWVHGVPVDPLDWVEQEFP